MANIDLKRFPDGSTIMSLSGTVDPSYLYKITSSSKGVISQYTSKTGDAVTNVVAGLWNSTNPTYRLGSNYQSGGYAYSPFAGTLSASVTLIADTSAVVQSPTNTYVDLVGGNTTIPFIVNIGNPGLSSFNYEIKKENGTLTTKSIGLDGNVVSGGSTWINNNSGVSYDVTVNRKITGIGDQLDNVTLNGATSSVKTYGYLTLQKAVPVTKYTTLDAGGSDLLTTTLAPNAVTPLVINTVIKLDKSSNRGDEVASSWEIFKTDPGGAFSGVAAVAGVDYQITSGDLNADVIKLKFINAAVNYEVRNTATGYTFSDNPFSNFASDVSTNTATTSYSFAAQSSFIQILFPKINVVLGIPPTALISTNPTTTYQNQNIVVSSFIDVPTGIFKIANILLTKTEAEWRTEIESRCNVTLEVRKKASNDLVISKSGLGPFTIKLESIDDFIFGFKTQLK